MTFGDMLKAVDELSPEELRELREYIQRREQQLALKAGTLQIDELLRGLEEVRAGLTDEEFRDIERAMNEEYIEPLDSNQ